MILQGCVLRTRSSHKTAKIFSVCLVVLVLGHSGNAQHDTPQSDRRVSYVLNVSLDSEARTLEGTGKMVWRNPDAVPVDTLQFHLYLNAFRDEQSTFLRERGGRIALEDRGHIEIIRLQTASGTELQEQLFFLHPDDGNVADRTVAAVVLPEPIMPGQEVEFLVTFTSQLPKILARTGYLERYDEHLFVMAAQWFPKFGVYEVPGQRYVPADAPRGQWNITSFMPTESSMRTLQPTM